jgi:alpha-tubulin suppressor-like RCC1 family protein
MMLLISNMRLKRFGQLVGALGILGTLWLAACSDGSNSVLEPSQPENDGEVAALITVSEPVLRPEYASDRALTSWQPDATLHSLDDDSVSFVSFPPGTFPEADSLQIANPRSGAVSGGLVSDGGLDPVAIPSSVGDSLSIWVLEASEVAYRIWILVPDRRPPVVVRTRPTRGETAVPLNSSIVIVFSEPIEVSTATLETVRLVRDGQPVPAELAVTPDGLTVALVPTNPLVPEADYAVVVADEIADLSGDRLQQEVAVPFTTAAAPELTAIIVSPDSVTVGAGLSVQLSVRDSNGTLVAASSLEWSSSDSSVVRISSDGLARGVSEGIASITVTHGELSANAVVNVFILPDLVSVTAGASHTCGLTGEGAAWCWGSDEFGQLGSAVIEALSLVPAAVETEQLFASISAGGDHTCAVTASGQLWCWGRSDFGQVGDGSHVNRLLPVPVLASSEFAGVTAGQDHTCARTTQGDAYCWGRNNNGQVGEGSQTDRSEPVPVSGGLVFSSLSAGVTHTCGTTTSDQHYCWGSNGSGQLSDPDVGGRSLTPNHPDNSGGFFESMVAVTAGKDHTCALQVDGTAWCGGTLAVDALEGRDENGNPEYGVIQCKNGDTGAPMNCMHVMFGVVPVIPYLAVTAGHEHSCSLAATGTVYCWGRDEYGQRGDQSTLRWTFWEPDTEPVVGALAFENVDAGAYHTCGVTTAGETYCWGRNDSGQVGDGTTSNRDVPRLVSF